MNIKKKKKTSWTWTANVGSKKYLEIGSENYWRAGIKVTQEMTQAGK